MADLTGARGPADQGIAASFFLSPRSSRACCTPLDVHG